MDYTHIECDFLRGLFLEEKGEAILSVIFSEVMPTFQDTLEESIRERDFQFMYQPIVNIKNRGIGLEMLARWLHKGEWISPVLFIPVIEKERLISSFTELIIDQLIADFRKLKRELRQVKFFSLNISPFIFIYQEEDQFLLYLTSKLKQHNISFSEICLEITESSMLDERAFKFLEDCNEKGFLIAIDDFGTGFSSLDYLIGTSFNVLKLDVALIRKITDNPRKIAIVESVLHLARKLHFRVVAEGVETKEQYQLLKEIGVDDIQGYYLSKPLFLEDIIEREPISFIPS